MRDFDSSGLELWGGIECTINRVGDDYFSQLERTGHAARIDDLDHVAALGIRALRYPVLWERVAPEGIERADWSWPDERLGRLRELGITPIVGLVHHGSGPAHTSLVDPMFATQLAEYASAVAERYPWIEFYTPVNEPLTTARFSGLYGVWYPHGRDERTFKEALLNQCRAVILAMRAIRRVNPRAKLVQTEDLGKTYSTPLLAYQADFNNELRWLAWDLLCGRVMNTHPLWKWLTRVCHARARELMWFVENNCPPEIVGANYYITSERFLDENLEKYPERYHGDNGRHRYADIEVARCMATPSRGIKPLLREASERYALPLAVTEAHIDSTRDDQLRWISEIWRAAEEARDEGIDMRAVTVWALFGSFDWNCLLSECRGYYEPGAFDVRGPTPRPTALAKLMRKLGANEVADHSILCGPGWWRRTGRFFCAPVRLIPCLEEQQTSLPLRENPAPILITGATGTLGQAYGRLCKERGLNYHLLSRGEMDIADEVSIQRALASYEPWAVINAAGYVRVDDAETDVGRCFRENTIGPAYLASFCAKHNIALMTFSSDLVFDGAQNAPYVETDPIAPLNIYGVSKAEAEKRVLDRHPGSLVIRTSAFFGPWDEYNFITVAMRALRQGQTFMAPNDLTVSPTYVPDLVNISLDLLIDGESGIWHLSNGGAVTWAMLVGRAAELAQVDSSFVQACPSEQLRFLAKRPIYSALGSSRSSLMPSLDDALRRYLSECGKMRATEGVAKHT